MTTKEKIPGTDEAWDAGQLGQSENHVRQAKVDIEQSLDDALALQLISIRLQKSLIEDFKYIASLNGIGYQPLMRQILTRFVESEKKRILREQASQRAREVGGASLDNLRDIEEEPQKRCA